MGNVWMKIIFSLRVGIKETSLQKLVVVLMYVDVQGIFWRRFGSMVKIYCSLGMGNVRMKMVGLVGHFKTSWQKLVVVPVSIDENEGCKRRVCSMVKMYCSLGVGNVLIKMVGSKGHYEMSWQRRLGDAQNVSLANT